MNGDANSKANSKVSGLRERAFKELTGNILPFWQGMKDNVNGGFYGKADFYGAADKTADKGGVLNSRILWTFSSAYRVTGNKEYMKYAGHALSALADCFYDREYGGVFWLLDCKGRPVDTKKQFYNLSFAVYALAEHYRAVNDAFSLDLAVKIYESLERYGFDALFGGYTDAKARDWSDMKDTSLSKKDLNCAKTMNTNLHVMEAYTNLLRCREVPGLRDRLRALIDVTADKIICADKRFNLFFQNDWTPVTDDISFGHDIEGSWLLYEAAQIAGGEARILRAKDTALNMAGWVLENMDGKSGGIINHKGAGVKEWWPQSEAVVGFLNAYEMSGDEKYLRACRDVFDFIDKVFVDRENGEWHNETSLCGEPDKTMPKVNMWKCPYHNARMCLELIERG